MELWKHGVEQILAEAGMQEKKTATNTLARQISTKVIRGAGAAQAEDQKKGDILSTGSFVEQEKG